MYDVIFFDLDGTLTNPALGITNSVIYALKKFGIAPPEERSELYKFIGPPLMESFQQYYHFSTEEARQAVGAYREYFRAGGLFENQVYSGIPELLAQLREKGKRLVVATSKPEVFSKQILEHFGLMDYFDRVAGASLDESRNSKGAVIAYALERCAITDPSRVLMVGDREHDILGARENGLDSLGVLYGFGSREELARAGAKYIAASVEEILPICCTEKKM